MYCACLMLYSCLYSLAHTRARAHVRRFTNALYLVSFARSLSLSLDLSLFLSLLISLFTFSLLTHAFRHGLKLFKVPYDGFSCSRCAQTFAHNPTTLLEGCRICDYDLCQSCAEPVGAWKNPSGEVRLQGRIYISGSAWFPLVFFFFFFDLAVSVFCRLNHTIVM